MKAILCHAPCEPEDLVLADIPESEPGEGEVVIGVRACALNFFDTLIIRGKYQWKPEPPFSPGGEVAGVIERLGPGVSGLAPGQRVMAHLRWNGCREKTVARAGATVPLPDSVRDEVAAGLTITYGTAMHGLKDRGRLTAGETVAVLGASGGAGLAAVEVASAAVRSKREALRNMAFPFSRSMPRSGLVGFWGQVSGTWVEKTRRPEGGQAQIKIIIV